MTVGRQMHGSAVLGDYLYLIGGNRVFGSPLDHEPTAEEEDWTTTVEKARIAADGSLGPWTETTPLPENRHYISTSTLALNDVIYVIGGKNGNDIYTNTAFWSRPGPDGELGTWIETPPFTTEGLSFTTVVSTPGYLHLVGGLNQARQPTANVISGRVLPDGALTIWEPGPPLPIPLWYHSALTSSGRVYVWGGLPQPTSNPISGVIFTAPILSSGQIGAWQEAPLRLPAPFYGGLSAAAGPFVISFCVQYPQTSSDVWFSRVTQQGMEPWQFVTTDLPNRLYFAPAPDYRRGRVYVSGGKFNRGQFEPSTEVVFFSLSEEAREQAPGQISPATLTRPEAGPEAPAAQEAVAQYTFEAQTRLASGAVPGFQTYEEARAQAARPPGRNLFLYFHHPVPRNCQEQVEILRDERFAELSRQAAFAWIDVREYPQLVQHLGVVRAPSWALYDPQGNYRGLAESILTLEQLDAAARGL